MEHGPEALHEDMGHEPDVLQMPAKNIKKPRNAAPESPVPEAKGGPLGEPTHIRQLTEALAAGKEIDKKELAAMIREAGREYMRLKKSDTGYARQYREDLDNFHALAGDYIDAFMDKQRDVCKKLKALKKVVPQLKEKETADEKEAAPEPQSFVGKILAFPGKVFKKVDDKLTDVVPGAKNLEKKPNRKAA